MEKPDSDVTDFR